jgi:hypothetical protein
MSKPLNALTSLLSRLGVAGPARLRVPSGTGAPKISRGSGTPSRRLVVSLIATILGALAFTAAPALAAQEKPELAAEDSTAVVATPSTEALLRGVLNPAGAGEPGTYRFLYKASKTGVCTGGSETTEGISPTGEREEPAEPITGLTPGTEYAACLRVENNTKTGSATSTPVTFTTALPPEKPETINPAEAVTATTATLEGTLNPHASVEAGWYFAYSTGATCTGASTSSQELATVVKAKLETKEVTGLEPGKTYRFCLVATNAAGEAATGNEVSFATPVAPPAVESKPASAIKATEARLEGVVNPNNQVTECKFLYGTEPLLTTGTTTALCEPASFPASFGGQGVGLNVPGLAQDTTYYYRAIASNPTGTTEGAIEHFTTALPPETPETKPANPIAATAATLHGVLNPHGERKSEPGGAEFLYRLSTTECQGESTASVEPATVGNAAEAVKAAVTALRPGSTYTFCLRAVNDAGEETLGSPETFTTPSVAPTIEGESVADVVANAATLQGQIAPGGGATTYSFEYGTSASYGAQIPVPAGSISGTGTVSVSVRLQGLQPETVYHYRLVAANALGTVDSTDQAFTTQAAGTTFALPDGRAWELVTPSDMAGYEVGAPDILYGGIMQAAENGESITYTTNGPIGTDQQGNPSVTQVLSTRGPGGWSSEDISPAHNEAVASELTEDGDGLAAAGTLGGEYSAFSPDLSLAYLSPSHWSTSLAPGTPAPPWSYDNQSEGYVRDDNARTYTLSKLSVQEWYAEQVALAHGSPSCDADTSPANGEGVDAVSEDGCYVYFNSESTSLAPGAAGKDPLYVAHYEAGKWLTRFISSLSSAEGTGDVPWGDEYVELSPNGQYVAFMSAASLTGYDNHDAVSGEPDTEVYLYDAAANRLACVSCNPTGARPQGQLDTGSGDKLDGVADEVLVDPVTQLAGQWLAGVLPARWNIGQGTKAPRQPRYLTDSGRVYFDSSDTLVAQAVNGLENVYEYEPEGVGSCGAAAGCVSMLSAGTSGKESALIEASASGDDVFFITSSRLTTQDQDNSFNLYDAHVCSASEPCSSPPPVAPPPCETSDSCKAPPTPQPGTFGAPASATFAGAGNVVPRVSQPVVVKKRATKCPKGKKLSQGKCVKKSKAKRKPARGRK